MDKMTDPRLLNKEETIIAVCGNCPFEGKFTDEDCHACQRNLEASAQAQTDKIDRLAKADQSEIRDFPDCCIGCDYAYKNEALQIDCACIENPPPNCHLNKPEADQRSPELRREEIKAVFDRFLMDTTDTARHPSVICEYADEVKALFGDIEKPLEKDELILEMRREYEQKLTLAKDTAKKQERERITKEIMSELVDKINVLVDEADTGDLQLRLREWGISIMQALKGE